LQWGQPWSPIRFDEDPLTPPPSPIPRTQNPLFAGGRFRGFVNRDPFVTVLVVLQPASKAIRFVLELFPSMWPTFPSPSASNSLMKSCPVAPPSA
jgi:hypothetical protein